MAYEAEVRLKSGERIYVTPIRGMSVREAMEFVKSRVPQARQVRLYQLIDYGPLVQVIGRSNDPCCVERNLC